MPGSRTVHLWLALDPETRRVLVQNREFGEGDFPPGLRGNGWPQRQLDAPADEFEAILAGTVSDSELDRLHRTWWNQAGREGEPTWPTLP